MSSKLGRNISKDEFDDMYNAMFRVHTRVVDFIRAIPKGTINNFDTEYDYFVKCVISYFMELDDVDTYTLSFMRRWWVVYYEALQNNNEAVRFEGLYKALRGVARRYIDLITPLITLECMEVVPVFFFTL